MNHVIDRVVATLATALYILFCVLFVVAATFSVVIYVFDIPRGIDAARIALLLFPAIGGIVLFNAFRTRLLRRPYTTKYGTIGPLEPGWSAYVNANLLAGVVVLAFGIFVNALNKK